MDKKLLRKVEGKNHDRKPPYTRKDQDDGRLCPLCFQKPGECHYACTATYNGEEGGS